MTMLFTEDDHSRLAAGVMQSRDPHAVFMLAEQLIRARIGFGLLTMLALDPDGEQVRRIYTTDPVHYPLSGTEALGSTPWGNHVLRQGKPFLGRDQTAVRWAFPGDFDLIESLGLGSTMNVPITAFGRTLGSMNILHGEHRYNQAHLDAACSLAPYLIPCFVMSRTPP